MYPPFVSRFGSDAVQLEYDTPLWVGVLLAVGVFVLPFLGELAELAALRTSFHLGVMFRAGVCAAVYRKALRLTTGARKQTDTGAIVSHISADPERIYVAAYLVPNFIYSPLQIMVSLVLLIRVLGMPDFGLVWFFFSFLVDC